MKSVACNKLHNCNLPNKIINTWSKLGGNADGNTLAQTAYDLGQGWDSNLLIWSRIH